MWSDSNLKIHKTRRFRYEKNHHHLILLLLQSLAAVTITTLTVTTSSLPSFPNLFINNFIHLAPL